MASLAARDVALPFDIRLMNGAASLLYALVAVGLVAGALLWLARSPWFTIRVLQLDGELQRSNVATIRANAMPRLAGNLITIDLERARAVFESVPWVRHATLRRIWPDRLAVLVEEHRPVALWSVDEGDEQLVNHAGEVFAANLGDVEDEQLPLFGGPPGSAPQLLAMYRRLVPALAPLGAELRVLQLSGRGSWRTTLAGGARIELGRGSDDEVAARVARFVASVGQVSGRFQREFESADLRHADGYALRLRGMTTTAAPAAAAKKPR
jgi:cell division protein FtsQ